MEKRFTRSISERKISGVCGGIAKYLNIDPGIVRLIYACLTLFSAAFPGIILYILMIIILPE